MNKSREPEFTFKLPENAHPKDKITPFVNLMGEVEFFRIEKFDQKKADRNAAIVTFVIALAMIATLFVAARLLINWFIGSNV